MKNKLLYINLLLVMFIFMPININARSDTSFNCDYYIPDDSLNLTRSGTLTCNMGYHFGWIIKNSFVECVWTTTSGSSIWTDVHGTSNFNLSNYLKTGTTECPTYASVQTSSSFFEQNGHFNNGIKVYFSNDLTDIQQQTANGGTYYGYGSEKNHSEEIDDFRCSNYTVEHYEDLFQKFEDEFTKYQENNCDEFELTNEEIENGVASPGSFQKYTKCQGYLTYADSYFRSELSTLKDRQDNNHCLDEDDYVNIQEQLRSYQSTYEDMREKLESEFTRAPDTPVNPDEPNEPDEPIESDPPDYKIEDASIGGLCNKSSYRKPMKFLGTLVNFFKYIVPIAIILFGLMDLYKAVTASKDDAIKKAVKSIAVRVIAGVFIFFLPGIVQFILNMVNEWSEYKNDWCCCTECLLNPDCNVNSCSSDSCHIEGTNK